MLLQLHIRWMIRRDMPEVMQIEQAGFSEEAWTEEDFLRCLRQRNCIGMVAEHGEKVAGFIVYELHKSKLQVIRLAVHPGYRRAGPREDHRPQRGCWVVSAGVGAAMLDKLKGKLAPDRRNRVCVDVADGKLGAQLFLRKCGFHAHVLDASTYRFVYRVPARGAEENAACGETVWAEEIS